MADGSKIEWCDATWQPITGCSVVSPGCTNCYAMRLAGTRLRDHPSRAGLTHDSKAGPVWTGEVRFNEQWLDQPLRWRKPRRIFVCAHGDLFHEAVPDEWIDRVFAVMALCPQHSFLVLTKRAARMRKYMTHACGRIADAIEPRRDEPDVHAALLRAGHKPDRAVGPLPWGRPGSRWWPLPNVSLGVSVENQPRFDERWLYLRDTPAAVRFISAEPLLGALDIRDALELETDNNGPAHHDLHWVIAGGESGLGARPCDLAWVRSLRDQCVGAGVPFFWKQHVQNGRKIGLPILDGRQWAEFPK